MNARLAAAALWAAVSCLPRSDDLGAYSAEWSPRSGDDAGSGGAAGAGSAAGAAGTAGSSSADAGDDGVVGGGSTSLGGGDGAGASSAAGSGALAGMGGSGDGPGDPDELCPDGVLSADATRCYVVSTEGAVWADARDECVALQATLVKVETADEDAFIGTLLGVNLWLGASDTATENVFVWTDGTPIEFGNWGADQPDRFPGPDCVEKRITAGRQWFDQPCDNVRAFVCERVRAGAPAGQ
jgi:hypothetical protein